MPKVCTFEASKSATEPPQSESGRRVSDNVPEALLRSNTLLVPAQFSKKTPLSWSP